MVIKSSQLEWVAADRGQLLLPVAGSRFRQFAGLRRVSPWAHVRQDRFGGGGWVLGLGDGPAYDQVSGSCRDGVGWRDHTSLVGMGLACRTNSRSDDGEVLAQLMTELGSFLGAGYHAVASAHDSEISEQDYLICDLAGDSGHLKVVVVHAG